MICGVVLGRGMRFFPLFKTSTLVADPTQPSLHSLLGSFAWDYCPVHQGTTYLCLVVRLTVGVAVLLFPICLHAVNSTTLSYFFTLWWLKGQVVQILKLVVYGGLSWISASTSYLKTQTSISWHVMCPFLYFLTLDKGQSLTANCPTCNTSLSELWWIDWFQLTHVFITVKK